MEKKKKETAPVKGGGGGALTKEDMKYKAVVKPDQPNLFGDQDRVYNVLQARVTELNAEINRCQETIEKKEDAITVLMGDLGETQKAVEIVRKQTKDLKDKEAKKAPKSKKKER